jgi:hypothetical protein
VVDDISNVSSGSTNTNLLSKRQMEQLKQQEQQQKQPQQQQGTLPPCARCLAPLDWNYAQVNSLYYHQACYLRLKYDEHSEFKDIPKYNTLTATQRKKVLNFRALFLQLLNSNN